MDRDDVVIVPITASPDTPICENISVPCFGIEGPFSLEDIGILVVSISKKNAGFKIVQVYTNMGRKRISPEEHHQHYDELLTFLDTEIQTKSKKKERGVNTLKRTRKMVRDLKKEQAYVRKSRKYNKDTCGFNKLVTLSDEMCTFLQIEKGSQLPRSSIVNAINVYCKRTLDEERPHMLEWKHLNPIYRNLQNPTNRRAIVPDEKLASLLKYDEYKKRVAAGEVEMKTKGIKCKVLDDSLYYYVIVMLIQPHMV
jgi:chromatin remodeling complex protein RSC6